MSHLIKEYDSAYRSESSLPSWHRLENISRDFTELRFPYTLESLPLPDNYVYGGGVNKFIVAHKDDKKIIISPASESYVLRGNAEIMDKVSESFEKHGIPAQLEFGLTMGNCGKLALTYSVENMSEFFAGGQEHKTYIVVVSGHDRSMGTKIYGSTTKVVCNNTLQMSLKGSKYHLDLNFLHSTVGQNDFKNLPVLMESCMMHVQEYSEFAEKLGNITINTTQAKMIALDMLSDDGAVTSQKFNAAENISHLFAKGLGNSGNNLWDFVGGITEYYTRGDGSGKKISMKKVISAEHGKAAEKKVELVNNFRTMDGEIISYADIHAMVQNGERLYKAYTDKKNAFTLV